ncbi:alpha/beta fold hydrolase [Candidatus Saccharibacteria bacterium]|nr:alpha/beta fold hydrolase [Candidatus Saccharibacteria bacterium]MCL1963136.1 alpha/beta fold hydrolase [Candidatus Saccharibacteria bacterium]
MNKDEFTNKEFMLNVGDGHEISVVDWGNIDAKTPIIFLHGGPGGNIKDAFKVPFNPKVQRVIFFDQRGCGKSTPLGSRQNNTIEKLADDITKIAKHLKIGQFYLNGYSWGSTLALYYAITRPEMVVGLAIGGVYNGSKEMDQVFRANAETFYPDIWDKVLTDTPIEHHNDPISYHQDKALNGTKAEQKKSAYVMDCLEGALCSPDDRKLPESFDEYDPAGSQIEIDYVASNCFMPKNFLLNNVHKIKVPVYIVQGRFDMVCPPNFAYEISKIIPNAKLYWAISNHSPEHEITQIFRAIFDSLG